MSEIAKRTENYREREVVKDVKAYIVSMPCNKCNGEMEFTGESYLTSPLCNIHKCNKCGHKEEFVGVTYPSIQYR